MLVWKSFTILESLKGSQLTILCLVSLSPDRRPSVILTVINKEINIQWKSWKPNHKFYAVHINFSFYCSLANSKEHPTSPCIWLKFSQVSAHPGMSFVWLTEHSCEVWEAKPQALCTSEVRDFVLYCTEGYYKVTLCKQMKIMQCTPCAHCDIVPFRVLCAIRTWHQNCWWLCYMLLFAQLFASNTSSYCEQDMGTLSWL